MDDLKQLIEFSVPSDCSSKLGSIVNNQGPLTSAEAKQVEARSTARRKEYTAGRVIARKLLKQYGLGQSELINDENGCPNWPDSRIKGSISHKQDMCLVLVSDSPRYLSLGVDLDVVEELSPSLWSVFCTAEELEQSEILHISKPAFANILFTVKEAHFKAMYPIFGTRVPSRADFCVNLKRDNNQLVTESLCRGFCFQGGVIATKNHLAAWVGCKNV